MERGRDTSQAVCELLRIRRTQVTAVQVYQLCVWASKWEGGRETECGRKAGREGGREGEREGEREGGRISDRCLASKTGERWLVLASTNTHA